MTQTTLQGRNVPDVVLVVCRASHARTLDGSLRPRLDLGRWFHQRRLEVA